MGMFIWSTLKKNLKADPIEQRNLESSNTKMVEKTLQHLRTG